MYAEGDSILHDWRTGAIEDLYFGRVPKYTGKNHAAYMVYVNYSDENAISNYASHYRAAKQCGMEK